MHNQRRTIPLRNKPSVVSGRRHRKKGKEKQCPTGNAPYDFLRTAFPAIQIVNPELVPDPHIGERLLDSIDRIRQAFDLQEASPVTPHFPENLLELMGEYNFQLSNAGETAEIIIAENSGHPLCMATFESYSTEGDFYFLPARPIYNIITDPIRSETPEALLTLSMVAYLFQVVNLTFFTKPNSSYYGWMECHRSWVLDSACEWDDQEDWNLQLSSMKEMEIKGGVVFKAISKRVHLKHFEKRVRTFIPFTPREGELYALANGLLDLFKSYPDVSLYTHMEKINPDDEYEYCAYPESYIGFLWDFDNPTFEHIDNLINMEMQEVSKWIQPISCQYYDTLPQKRPEDLSFDRQLYPLLESFREYLNNME